jgi:hypothetical protein
LQTLKTGNKAPKTEFYRAGRRVRILRRGWVAVHEPEQGAGIWHLCRVERLTWLCDRLKYMHPINKRRV